MTITLQAFGRMDVCRISDDKIREMRFGTQPFAEKKEPFAGKISHTGKSMIQYPLWENHKGIIHTEDQE